MIMDYLIPKMQSKKKKIKIIYLLLGENLIKSKNLQYMTTKKVLGTTYLPNLNMFSYFLNLSNLSLGDRESTL